MFGHLWPLALVAAQEQPAPSCAGGQFLLPVIMVAILYFVWLRPAQMDRKKHEDLLKSIKRGDEVLTSTGIFGTVADIQEKVVTLEVARNVKIRVLRSAILRKVEADKDQDTESKK